jgi:hypothetical protein
MALHQGLFAMHIVKFAFSITQMCMDGHTIFPICLSRKQQPKSITSSFSALADIVDNADV